MKNNLSHIEETPISPEHEKAIIDHEAYKAAQPLAVDADMLAVERDGLIALAAAMREHMASQTPDGQTAAIWQDRISRMEAQAAVVALALTDKASRANRIFAERNDLHTAIDLEQNIKPGASLGNKLH